MFLLIFYRRGNRRSQKSTHLPRDIASKGWEVGFKSHLSECKKFSHNYIHSPLPSHYQHWQLSSHWQSQWYFLYCLSYRDYPTSYQRVSITLKKTVIEYRNLESWSKNLVRSVWPCILRAHDLIRLSGTQRKNLNILFFFWKSLLVQREKYK